MAGSFDRMRLAPVADWLAAATAASLPWSTSATAILVVLWLIALVLTLTPADFRMRRDLATAAALLPVLLVLLGALGMLWADVSWAERFKGVDSFAKLLAIPLLLMQFRRSERGACVFAAYLISCTLLMLASTVVLAVPALSAALMHPDNVLVKNSPTQSGEFVTCIAGLLYLSIDAVETRRRWRLVGFAAIALGMFANIAFVATGRTALIVLLVLLVLFASRMLSARGIIVLCAVAVSVGSVAWVTSPNLRARTEQVWSDLQKYETVNERNSSGERIEFAKKSIDFIRAAPILGHGTGTIPSLFAQASVGQTGAGTFVTTNPHNQTFAVGIQLGLLGMAVLWAMWLAHLLLFRGAGLAEWIGTVIVVQNVVGSLFNSHLFDFTQGWVYAIGVGVAGGMVLKNRERAS